MQSIASSIVILASCITFSAAAFVPYASSGAGIFLNIVGVVVGLIGLGGWFASPETTADSGS